MNEWQVWWAEGAIVRDVEGLETPASERVVIT